MRSQSKFRAPAAPADNRPVIVAFGDSLTAGVSGKSYPESLQTLLDQSPYKYRVENQGVSGDTTTEASPASTTSLPLIRRSCCSNLVETTAYAASLSTPPATILTK